MADDDFNFLIQIQLRRGYENDNEFEISQCVNMDENITNVGVHDTTSTEVRDSNVEVTQTESHKRG